jgi:hypothetical protein
VFAHQVEQLRGRSALADDVVASPFQEAGQPFTQQDVVVGHDDARAVLSSRRLHATIISHECLLPGTEDYGNQVSGSDALHDDGARPVSDSVGMSRTRLLVVVIITVVCSGSGAASGGAVSDTAMTTLKRPLLTDTTQVSSNWSGYVVAGSDAGATPSSFTNVGGRWVQPKARCAVGRASSSAFWVGIGGASDTSHALEQIGTQVTCSASGKAAYSMWYELVPAASVKIKYKVLPGNVITASVTVKGTKVTLQIRNLSRRTRFTKVLSTSAPDTSSAEWVAEAPSACLSAERCVVVPLTDFGTVSFTNATAMANGHRGTISDPAWVATPVVLDSSRQDPSVGSPPSSDGAVPSPLSPDGAAFNVAYRATLSP